LVFDVKENADASGAFLNLEGVRDSVREVVDKVGAAAVLGALCEQVEIGDVESVRLLSVAVVPPPVDRLDDPTKSLHALANTFPSLAAKQIQNLGDLLKICADETAGSGSRWAARFVVSLWRWRDADSPYAFVFAPAWAAWDDAHRAAWKAWAADPWWV